VSVLGFKLNQVYDLNCGEHVPEEAIADMADCGIGEAPAKDVLG
jgi:hypothetical protein